MRAGLCLDGVFSFFLVSVAVSLLLWLKYLINHWRACHKIQTFVLPGAKIHSFWFTPGYRYTWYEKNHLYVFFNIPVNIFILTFFNTCEYLTHFICFLMTVVGRNVTYKVKGSCDSSVQVLLVWHFLQRIRPDKFCNAWTSPLAPPWSWQFFVCFFVKWLDNSWVNFH